eukprot:358302-Chlamydomonas_euryale.AAC.6
MRIPTFPSMRLLPPPPCHADRALPPLRLVVSVIQIMLYLVCACWPTQRVLRFVSPVRYHPCHATMLDTPAPDCPRHVGHAGTAAQSAVAAPS